MNMIPSLEGPHAFDCGSPSLQAYPCKPLGEFKTFEAQKMYKTMFRIGSLYLIFKINLKNCQSTCDGFLLMKKYLICKALT
jgi:hypothetical protein